MPKVKITREAKTAYAQILLDEKGAKMNSNVANKGVAGIDWENKEPGGGMIQVTLQENPSSWPLVLCQEAETVHGRNYNEFFLRPRDGKTIVVTFAAVYE